MSKAEDKIYKAIKGCQKALSDLHNNNKRRTVGDLDHVREDVIAAIHLLISEIEQEEGKF